MTLRYSRAGGLAMRLIGLFSLLWLIGSPAAAQDLAALKAMEGQGAKVSALVYDLSNKRVLAQHQSSQSLIPASVTKLVTSWAALETWPAHKSFQTRLLLRGRLDAGRLQGDLVLEGGGDPTLTDAQLWQMVRKARQLGLTSVSGNLVINIARFGRLDCQIQDRCRAQQVSSNSYDAALSALSVNYNNIALLIAPGGRAGQRAELALLPFDLPSYEVRGQVSTQANATDLRLDRRTHPQGEELRASGSVGAGASSTYYRSVGRPELYAGEIFAALLAEAGIELRGGILIEEIPVTGADSPFLVLDGDPLSEALARMQRFSNNLVADQLALSLLVERQPSIPPQVPSAGRELLRLFRKALQGRRETTKAQLFDGSGLDPRNRLSAKDLAALLRMAYEDARLFPLFYGTLNVPDERPQQSALRRANKLWLENLAVKTGGLTQPVSVITIAGYARKEDGGWLAFAFLVNGPSGRALNRFEVFAEFEKDLLPFLR